MKKTLKESLSEAPPKFIKIQNQRILLDSISSYKLSSNTKENKDDPYRYDLEIKREKYYKMDPINFTFVAAIYEEDIKKARKAALTAVADLDRILGIQDGNLEDASYY